MQAHTHKELEWKHLRCRPLLQASALHAEPAQHLVEVDVQGWPGSRRLHRLQLQLFQMGGRFAVQGRCSWTQFYNTAVGEGTVGVETAARYSFPSLLLLLDVTQEHMTSGVHSLPPSTEAGWPWAWCLTSLSL